jgi:hypothetical protein
MGAFYSEILTLLFPQRQEVVGTCKVLPIGRAHATFPFMQPPVLVYRLAISLLCLWQMLFKMILDSFAPWVFRGQVRVVLFWFTLWHSFPLLPDGVTDIWTLSIVRCFRTLFIASLKYPFPTHVSDQASHIGLILTICSNHFHPREGVGPAPDGLTHLDPNHQLNPLLSACTCVSRF